MKYLVYTVNLNETFEKRLEVMETNIKNIQKKLDNCVLIEINKNILNEKLNEFKNKLNTFKKEKNQMICFHFTKII